MDERGQRIEHYQFEIGQTQDRLGEVAIVELLGFSQQERMGQLKEEHPFLPPLAIPTDTPPTLSLKERPTEYSRRYHTAGPS